MTHRDDFPEATDARGRSRPRTGSTLRILRHSRNIELAWFIRGLHGLLSETEDPAFPVRRTAPAKLCG